MSPLPDSSRPPHQGDRPTGEAWPRPPRRAKKGPLDEHPPGEQPREGPPYVRELCCRRCHKRITDLEMEVYFLQLGLCFWCAYVDSQG